MRIVRNASTTCQRGCHVNIAQGNETVTSVVGIGLVGGLLSPMPQPGASRRECGDSPAFLSGTVPHPPVGDSASS